MQKFKELPDVYCVYDIHDPVLKSVMKTADNLDGHSGATMSWTVGSLVRIYKLGWPNFVKQYMKDQIKKN